MTCSTCPSSRSPRCRPLPRRRPPARQPGPPPGARRAGSRRRVRSPRSAAGGPGVLRRRPERGPGRASSPCSTPTRCSARTAAPPGPRSRRCCAGRARSPGARRCSTSRPRRSTPCSSTEPPAPSSPATASRFRSWASRSPAGGSPRSTSCSIPCGWRRLDLAGLPVTAGRGRFCRPAARGRSPDGRSAPPSPRSCAGSPRGRWVSRHRRACRGARSDRLTPARISSDRSHWAR